MANQVQVLVYYSAKNILRNKVVKYGQKAKKEKVVNSNSLFQWRTKSVKYLFSPATELFYGVDLV